MRGRSTDGALPPAITDAACLDIDGGGGRLACYHAGGAGPPLLLLHSINAAASAYEVRPIFERLRGRYALFAPDLPGFGRSARDAGRYDVARFVAAIDAVLDEIAARHGSTPVHTLALSLTSELLARAVRSRPRRFATAALVSPTGFEAGRGKDGRAEDTREVPALSRALGVRWVGAPLFSLLTREASIRYFLRRTFGRRDIDEGLAQYDVLTAQQPGAHHAPLAFVSGRLFSQNARALYEALELPVWLAHGVRGDFVDYGGAAWTRARDNWSIRVFETGALPHFEVPSQFCADYESFLDRKEAA